MQNKLLPSTLLTLNSTSLVDASCKTKISLALKPWLLCVVIVTSFLFSSTVKLVKSKVVVKPVIFCLAANNSTIGASKGAFLITVIFSSCTLPAFVFKLLTYKLVWVFIFVVPNFDLVMFIFLGSELLSVQNNKSSTIFIPVTL